MQKHCPALTWFFSNRVNRTVKTITEKEKHKSYRESVYVLNEDTDNWILLEEQETNDELTCRIIACKTQTQEVIQTYRLEI